jgi:hypothetical protein
MLASTILGSTGNYTTALYVINVALVVGLVCVGLLRWNISTVEESKGTSRRLPPTDIGRDRDERGIQRFVRSGHGRSSSIKRSRTSR